MKADWFPFEPYRFLEGTADFSNRSVGIYQRLLCHQFSRGGYLPVDIDRVARLVYLDPDDAEFRTVLREKFPRTPKGYANRRMLETVRGVERKIDSARDAANRRWTRDRDERHEKSEKTRRRRTKRRDDDRPDDVSTKLWSAYTSARDVAGTGRLDAEWFQSVLDDTKYMTLDLASELQRFSEYWGDRGFKGKSLKLSLRSWLRKATEFNRDDKSRDCGPDGLKVDDEHRNMF